MEATDAKTGPDWSIQDVARLAGTTSRTLRHYDEIGLLKPSRVGSNGYRYYDGDALLQLQRILLLRELGLGLPAIAEVFQQQLADILGNATASLALMVQLARIQEEGKLEMAQAALAKATTTRLARASVAMGRSLLGGNGISADFEMGKLFGDAEILYTYEGSYEINSLIVGRAVTGKSAFA